uniref:FBA_2 domain-containing protein n=1 Tax=Caenorhabditis tropicalis TaxID=1561998 RepID=A0A1I7TRV9_9PELO
MRLIYLLLISLQIVSAKIGDSSYAEELFSRLTLQIRQRSSLVDSYFNNGFQFHGCNGVLGKDSFILMLYLSRQNLTFDVIANTTKTVNLRLSQVTVKTRGLDHDDFLRTSEAIFFIDGTSLYSGFVPECTRLPFGIKPKLPLDPKDTDKHSEDFLNKLNEAIKSNNASNVKEHLLIGFEYNRCGKRLDKIAYAKLLADPSRNLSFSLSSSQNIGGEFRIIANVKGSNSLIDFYLDRNTSKLASASVLNCIQSSIFPSSSLFLKIIEEKVKSRDVFTIRELFTDNFHLETCHGSYDKDSFVYGIAGIPTNFTISIKLEKLERVGDNLKLEVKAPASDSRLYELWAIVSKKYGPQIRSAKVAVC